MPIVETLISSVVFCAAGFSAGYVMSKRKAAIEKMAYDADSTCEYIISASDLRAKMMEDALKVFEGESEPPSRKNLKTAARTAHAIVKNANRLIEMVATRQETTVWLAEQSEVFDEDSYHPTQTFNLDKYIHKNASNEDRQQSHRLTLWMVRNAYESLGYDVFMTTDCNWKGDIFVSIRIDWSNHEIDKPTLAQIEDISQIEAYRAGVPLADILA